MKIKISFLLFAIISLQFFAQQYVPMSPSTEKELTDESIIFLKNSEEFRKDLKNEYKGKLGKQLEINFQDMQTDFNQEILDGNMVFNEQINGFLTKILNAIYTKNPDVPKMKIYVTRDASANAYAMGDGNILINLGLFQFLDNEAEIASVLSHEIGHQMLKHSINTQISNFEKSQSRDFKKDVAEIRKSKYNTQNKALNLLKEHIYNLSAKTRINELQADSIGYEIYRNTDFAKDQYIQALSTLEKYDTLTPRGLKKDTYRKVFDIEVQPFNEEWLELEDFSQYDYNYQDKIDEDSVSSHPETEARIKRLKELFPELNSRGGVDEASSEYNAVRRIAKYERIPNYFFNEQYGDGVYLALLNLQDDPDNEYYKYWLGKNFNEIYKARKNYTLNRYVDRIDPESQSQSYQQFLSFIWNLRLEEIENIAKYYYKEE